MATKGIYVLSHNQARERAIDHLLKSPATTVVLFKEPTRTLEQNALAHSLFRQIADSGLTWSGRKLSEDQWKVLLVSGHAIATGHEADIVPGIENELVNLRESTANMSIKRLSSLIEYTQAFMAEHDIPIQEVPKSRPW